MDIHPLSEICLALGRVTVAWSGIWNSLSLELARVLSRQKIYFKEGRKNISIINERYFNDSCKIFQSKLLKYIQNIREIFEFGQSFGLIDQIRLP